MLPLHVNEALSVLSDIEWCRHQEDTVNASEATAVAK